MALPLLTALTLVELCYFLMAGDEHSLEQAEDTSRQL